MKPNVEERAEGRNMKSNCEHQHCTDEPLPSSDGHTTGGLSGTWWELVCWDCGEVISAAPYRL